MTWKDTELKPQSKSISWKYITPLAFAPTLPLIRIGLRKNPRMQSLAFGGVVALGLAHGTYLIMSASDENPTVAHP